MTALWNANCKCECVSPRCTKLVVVFKKCFNKLEIQSLKIEKTWKSYIRYRIWKSTSAKSIKSHNAFKSAGIYESISTKRTLSITNPVITEKWASLSFLYDLFPIIKTFNSLEANSNYIHNHEIKWQQKTAPRAKLLPITVLGFCVCLFQRLRTYNRLSAVRALSVSILPAMCIHCDPCFSSKR